uniref:NADH-ubiquinone oxidoreductase chain 4L n=1 Tax=Scarites buparius TaxID=76544 RepID=A0A343EZ34_9CARA|nr:NADH dehydrogenase subunit 4L [Scarites buparius]
MIYLYNILGFVFMFFMGLVVFSSKRKHLLLMLLSLEFIILSLYILVFIYLSMYDYEYYFSMLYLTFCVCESVLGLSILVSLIRTHGNDFFFSMNLLC